MRVWGSSATRIAALYIPTSRSVAISERITTSGRAKRAAMTDEAVNAFSSLTSRRATRQWNTGRRRAILRSISAK